MAKIEETLLRNSRPSDTKERGIAILGTIVMSRSQVIVDRMIPKIEQLIRVFATTCPSEGELRRIVRVRNNIVVQANSIGNLLSNVASSLQIASTFIGAVIAVIGILRGAKIGASLAAKFLPITPGAVPSILSDLDDFITNITFNSEGNPRLPPIKQQIDGIALPISLIVYYINRLLSTLQLLDQSITECQLAQTSGKPLNEVKLLLTNNPRLQNELNSQLGITPVSEDLANISQIQNEADDSPNLSTYQGFIIEIEEVPFSSTVSRKRAVGKNQDGIILIQTELSFTTVDQILINELKFAIDKDNLKAY